MRNIKKYGETLFENDESKEIKLIPFITNIRTIYKHHKPNSRMQSYWYVGMYESYYDLIRDLFYVNAIEIEPEGEDLKDFYNIEELRKTLNKKSGDDSKEITLWSDGLEINQYRTKPTSTLVTWEDPFLLVTILESYFTNARKIMTFNKEGNADSDGYLLQSLENKPHLAEYYPVDELKRLLDTSSMDEKKKKSLITLNKIKGMY